MKAACPRAWRGGKAPRGAGAHGGGGPPRHLATRCAAAAVPRAAASSSALEDAVAALASGRLVAVLDDAEREAETDLFAAAELLTPARLRELRTSGGGELYLSTGSNVAATFGIPYLGRGPFALAEVHDAFPLVPALAKSTGEMCQGACSVGLSIDHRSTKTGAPDDERALTCRRFAELAKIHAGSGSGDKRGAREALAAEFHTPGHIFTCVETPGGVAARGGHTELGAALARLAGLTEVVVGCVMLRNDPDDPEFDALDPAGARAWAAERGIPFVTGSQVLELTLAHGSAQ